MKRNMTYKNLFQKIKKGSKKTLLPKKLKLFQNNVTDTWNITKEDVSKSKQKKEVFPKCLLIDENGIKE